MIRTNILIRRYLNIFEYLNICHTLTRKHFAPTPSPDKKHSKTKLTKYTTWADEESKGKSNASNAKDKKDPSCNQQTLSLEEKEGIIGFPKMKLSEKVKVKEILNWDGKGKKDLNLI